MTVLEDVPATVATAPAAPPAAPSQTSPTKSWLPTTKWMAATITALTAVACLVVTHHGFDTDVTVALITVIGQALVTYLVPNQETPGGVPVRSA